MGRHDVVLFSCVTEKLIGERYVCFQGKLSGKVTVGIPTKESVEGIFTGRIRDWSQVPGARVSGAIDLFDRDGASGTQDAFQHIFLEETQRISPSATAETSNGLEQNAVSGDKNAIGFVSFAFTAGVNAVGYQGVACNLRNAKSGQYGGVRNFWMVTKGVPKGAASKFIAWITSDSSFSQSMTFASKVGSAPTAGPACAPFWRRLLW